MTHYTVGFWYTKDRQCYFYPWNPKHSSILILYEIEVARRTPISRGSDTNTVTQLLLRNVAAWCISSISSVRFIDLRTLNLGQNKKDLYILTCMYHVSMHKINFDVLNVSLTRHFMKNVSAFGKLHLKGLWITTFLCIMDILEKEMCYQNCKEGYF